MSGVRMRVVVTFEYDAYPNDYDDSSPKAMAAVDEANWFAEPCSLADMLTVADFRISVEPQP